MRTLLSKAGAGLLIVLYLNTASAQMDELVDDGALAAKIVRLASSIRSQVDILNTKVASLPDDLTIMGLFYDDMLVYVDRLLTDVGPDTVLAKDITRLKLEAEVDQDNWRQLCNTTELEEDCYYAGLWDKRVEELTEQEATWAQIIADTRKAREMMLDRRKYAVADIKLDLYNDSIEKLDNTVDVIDSLANRIALIAVDVGGEEYALIDTY